MSDKFNILVVHAHPADFACEAAGTVALHAENGDRITVVITSYGEKHHAQPLVEEYAKPQAERNPALINLTLDQWKEIKKQEAERIGDILGARDLIFLGWPDYGITLTPERVEEMRALIAKVKPDIIITHAPLSYRAPFDDDHIHLSHIVWHAITAGVTTLPQFDNGKEPYYGVKQVFWFPMGGDVHSRFFMTGGFVCDVWVDTTRVIDKKVRAIDQVVSQGYEAQAARKIIEARDGHWGMIAGCSYAEPFMRPHGLTYDLLPMPERVMGRRYKANDLPGDRILAVGVPSAVPANGLSLRR